MPRLYDPCLELLPLLEIAVSHPPPSPKKPSPWFMRGGVTPERVERAFGDDFDELLPARELQRQDLAGEEPIIELRFGTTG